MILFCVLSLFLADISVAISHDIPVNPLSQRDEIHHFESRAISIPPLVIHPHTKERRSLVLLSSMKHPEFLAISRRSAVEDRLSSRSLRRYDLLGRRNDAMQFSSSGLRHGPNLKKRGACLSRACGKKSSTQRPSVDSRTTSMSAARGTSTTPNSQDTPTGSPLDKFRVDSPSFPPFENSPAHGISHRSRRPSSAETVHPGGPRQGQRPRSAESIVSGGRPATDRSGSADSFIPGSRSAIARQMSAESIIPGGRRSANRPGSSELTFLGARERPSLPGEIVIPSTPREPSESEMVTPGLSSSGTSSRIESFYPHRGGERRAKMTGSPRSSLSGSPIGIPADP